MLREQEAGAKPADLRRRHGISSATFYAWKTKFGGMDASEEKRLKALEAENVNLTRLLSDAMLDASVVKDLLAKMVTPAAVPAAVAYVLREHDTSERAGSILGADRSTIRYCSRWNDDAPARELLRELSTERRRFGYGASTFCCGRQGTS